MNIITEAAQNPGSGMTSAADFLYTDHTTRKLGLMIYANKTDINGVKKNGTWPRIKQLLNKRDTRSNKSGKAFSPGVLKQGTTRASANVAALYMAVADIDDDTKLDILRPAIEGYAWAAYSSHSHTEAHSKYRLVFPLRRSCNPEEWPAVWAGLNVQLDGHCDQACKDPSRLYYLPSCPPETHSAAFYEVNEGEWLDPDLLIGLGKPTLADKPSSHADINDELGVRPQYQAMLETPEEIARVKSMLAVIPANCDRSTWRNICWAVMATGWACAEDLAREWSMTAPELFDESSFQKVVDSYRPDGGISFGTLVHHAQQHGWVEPQSSDPLQVAFREMNTRYFVARIGGGVFVFDEQDRNILSGGMAFTAFKQLHAGRVVNGVNVAAAWLSRPERRTYERVVFDPAGNTETAAFNTWRGLAVAPAAGSCVLILEHIRLVWCSGNMAQFEYVIRWLALLVQRPWQKPEVALVLRSREGTGKTIIVQILLNILGVHGFVAAQKDQVAGRFNGHLFDKVLVVLEEAFFAGDPAAVSATKALVTNQTLGYEAKGKDAFSAANFAHVISMTNHEWAAPAGEDSRRWMMMDVSDAKRGKHDYFAALAAEIENGGTGAFLHHLLSIGLTDWNPRALPESNALHAQQRETMMRSDPVAAWWYHVLAEGTFTVEGGALDWANEIDAKDAQDSYIRASARARNAPTWDAAAKRLRKYVPTGAFVKSRKSGNGIRHFVYSLPDIADARICFSKATGVDPCAA